MSEESATAEQMFRNQLVEGGLAQRDVDSLTQAHREELQALVSEDQVDVSAVGRLARAARRHHQVGRHLDHRYPNRKQADAGTSLGPPSQAEKQLARRYGRGNA